MPTPILFLIKKTWAVNQNPFRRKGIGPSMALGTKVIPGAPLMSVTGVTKDSGGSPLGGCTVKCYRTSDDSLVGTTVSDGSGNYSFVVGQGQLYYCAAWKAGAPDVAGATDNNLVGS